MSNYKSPNTNQQFTTIYNFSKENNETNENNTNIFNRLVSLTMKRFNKNLHERVCNILSKNNTDDVIYNDLYKLYNSNANKIPRFVKRPNKNNETVAVIMFHLKHFLKYEFEKKSIENYLDVGSGNGRFCKIFGKELNLNNDNIHGIDIPSFSEQGDWNRNNFANDIVFTTININDKYPYPDNKFDIITMKMVLHHIENIELTFTEISRVLRNDGYLIIIEHDVSTYLDYILCEIEHLYYIKVYNKKINYKENNNLSDDINNIDNSSNNIDDIDKLGYIKFRNLDENIKICNQFGFNELQSDFFYENSTNISPTRNYWTILQLTK